MGSGACPRDQEPAPQGEGVGTCGQSWSAHILHHKQPAPWPAEPPSAWPGPWGVRDRRWGWLPLYRCFSRHPQERLLLEEALEDGAAMVLSLVG